MLAGPWQLGRVDQGVFAFWMLAHHFGRPLTYIGFGGTGKQVRDLLHVDDLVDLVEEQLREPERWRGAVFNVGGGREQSLSLLELTDLCRELSGQEVEIDGSPETRPGDVPVYVSDCSALFARTTWRPQRSSRQVLEDISTWAAEHGSTLREALELRGRTVMATVIVTGSGGLIGSESVAHFVEAGYDVIGIENDMRAYFFGPGASTAPQTRRLLEQLRHVPLARARHPRRRRRSTASSPRTRASSSS